MIHDFATSLRVSQEQATATWWEPVYREAFPDFGAMTYVGDCPAQRDGVDRVIVTNTGHIYRVDEKVRTVDRDDFCLEYWSKEHEVKGWIAKDLACDFIAYAFIPSRRCYLLPFPSLRRAWRKNHLEWVTLGKNKSEGFRTVRAENPGYTTVSVAVPIPRVLSAMTNAFLIRWEAA